MAKIGAFLLLALWTLASLAQTYGSGSVLKWEMKSYSQSAHIIRDHVVYSVQVGDSVFQIARRSRELEMSIGQRIQCRIDKGHVFVLNAKGKETEYDILGAQPATDSPAVR
jgi:hypothetical protein